MDIEKAKEKLKGIDIKFFLNGMTEQSNYIVDKADEINIAIETVLSELEKKEAIINEMSEYLASIDFDEHCVEVPGICIGCPKEDDLDGYMQCIKQYFTKKVEGK